MSDVGLQVTEGVADGSTPYVDPAKRNIGLLMERERGVEGVPVKFVSPDEDSRIFGGEFTNTYGSYAVRTLFENAVNIPATIYGVRIVGSGSTAASLSKTVATKTVAIKAGRRGKEDKGTWGNKIKCTLYSYGLKNRNAFTLEVYYKGKLVETFYAATCALLQNQINSISDFVTITFSGEIAQTIDAKLTGTGTWSILGAPYQVVGVGTAFDTELAVGDVLMAYGNKVGTVKTITDATHVVLNDVSAAYPYANYNYYNVNMQYIHVNTSFAEDFQLANGTYTAPTEQDFYPSVPDAPIARGLACLNTVDVQLIAVTENNTLTMAQQLRAYCAGRLDKPTAITILPLNASDVVCELYAAALQTSTKSAIAGYNLWVSILDSAGNSVVVPGIGVILGAGYLRTPFTQGNYAHIPPAGLDSVFVGVQECFPDNVDKPRLNRLTRDFTVNSIVFKQGTGYYIATSRTYSTNPLFMSVHSNILASYYLRYIDQNMDFVNQKPNTPDLRVRLYNALRSFFKDQWDIGALEKEIPFAEAVEVICDRSNNPLNGDRKSLNAEVKYIITEAVESTTIALNRNDGILTTKVVE